MHMHITKAGENSILVRVQPGNGTEERKRGNVSQSRFLNHYSSDTVRKQHTEPLHQRAK